MLNFNNSLESFPKGNDHRTDVWIAKIHEGKMPGILE